MAYKKANLEKQSLTAIKKHTLKFVSHLVAFLPCSSSTFYDLELEKSESIKKALEENRTNAKVKALHRWEHSENPTLEIAFYKLIGDEDECERLNGSRQKIDHSGEVKHDIKGEITVKIDQIYGKASN